MKIFLDTIGCRLNQAEIESMGRKFRAAGHEIVAQPGSADMAVVNTCAVTVEASSDSRGAVRRLGRAGVPEIVVTGCWATLQARQAGGLPNVVGVVPNSQKDQLAAGILNLSEDAFGIQPIARQPLPGMHQRTRAFIKVQEGCNNRCTFCVTTIARGAGISRGVRDVIADIRSALHGGSKEVVLTGVHLGSWGQELGLHLRDLVRSILRETDAPRIRLSSLEPWDLDADFFALWQEPRLCQHLHLPLQSGCAATLRRMARKTTPASFRALVTSARQMMPNVAITTDIMAGFPGETEEEFSESLEFVREMEFAGGHAFSYSPRPGTAAARMRDQVAPELRKVRNGSYRALFQQSSLMYRRQFVGKQLDVLWESTVQMDDGGWLMEGLTGNYLRVTASASRAMWNEVSSVRLESLRDDGLAGTIIA
jgi:threonylcarbamoyladenosine tRNA methylthiotransferase MtaB